MRQPLVVGNWKMHGSLGSNQALLDALRSGAVNVAEPVEIAVCVPYPYLAQARQALEGERISWGAQSISEHDSGAFTGEVSGAMLAEFGCRHVIVGHSERRALFGESDERVAAKFGAALRHGLVPILCVGETLHERERGETEQVVGRQLDAVLAMHGAGAFDRAILAYEPVWAIGTGRNADPEQAQSVHAFLRARVARSSTDIAGRLRVLYGGSVKPANAKALFGMPDIDGGLIGGASLVAADFLGIAGAARGH